MSIVVDVSEQLKDAMRAKDANRVGALRQIRAGLIAKMKESGAETLEDETSLEVIRRIAKQINESIEAFDAGGRPELAATERAQLQVVAAFLPSLADAETTRVWVQEAIAATGASSKREFGKVMGFLMKHHRGDIDAKLANQIAGELLG